MEGSLTVQALWARDPQNDVLLISLETNLVKTTLQSTNTQLGVLKDTFCVCF